MSANSSVVIGHLPTGVTAAALFAATLAYFNDPTLSLSVRPNQDEGQSWVEVLPADDREFGVFAAARIEVPGSRLVEWARRVELLYKSRYVPVIGRFSHPPRIEDLQGLTLDDKDLEDIRKCEPGDCGVKLSDHEIEDLRQTIAHAGINWTHAAQNEFRNLVLARAKRYLAEGDAGAPPYHDKKRPVSLESEFATIIDRSELSTLGFPGLADYLKRYPRVRDPGIESFLYWSKENLGGRPTVTVTHVSIVCPREPEQPEALIIGKQVFASHYMTAGLGITAITSESAGSQRYLVYLNLSRTDIFEGMFGGWVRKIVERRVRSEAPRALDALRLRLEGGPPEGVTAP
jgi:hypothetical protein